MRPLRIGLLGYGFGGRHFHAPLIASSAECEFLGVVTTSPQRRAEFDDVFSGRQCFDSLEELVDKGAEAVAISTPAATHVELARHALKLGLAVVSDKPFALDAASARETVELAEQLGVPLTVYQNRRRDSDFLTVRRLLDDGALGEPTRFESRFERYSPEPGPPAAGSGTLLDFGSHLVDQALVLFGSATSVYAEMHTRPDNGLDDDVFIALTHATGVRSHLWGSWRQSAPGPRFRVSGTTGSFVITGVDGMDGQESRLIAGQSPATEADWGIEPEASWGHHFHEGTVDSVVSERGRWDEFYPAFARAVRGEGALPVDPWDAVRTATVLDAARTSALTGNAVALPEE